MESVWDTGLGVFWVDKVIYSKRFYEKSIPTNFTLSSLQMNSFLFDFIPAIQQVPYSNLIDVPLFLMWAQVTAPIRRGTSSFRPQVFLISFPSDPIEVSTVFVFVARND